MNTTAIILAAGQASRMRLEGEFKSKALLPLPYPPAERDNGPWLPALACLAQTYRQAGVQDIMLVSGYHQHETETLARELGLLCANNSAPWAGMFSSVRTALAAMAPCDSFFVNPVDVPLIAVDTIRSLLAQSAVQPDAVLVPVHAGEEGHPPLIPGQYRERILSHDGDNGLAGALQALPRMRVDVADPFVLEDMDTPEDYARLCRASQSRLGALHE